ncbi:DNA polymerase IV [Amycolatopsis minnesotensis]|uniref:DNA polymerase IV n=1 Tax=Amycolatopsis minnesotensis TaxID=337894 RepID=A0ABN2Q4F6_9PSEU
MQRWVVHLDLDAFYASVEQHTRPTLRGRPVLVGGSGPRAVVAGASYEAREYGARSAMPMSQARRLVPAGAVTLPARFSLYEAMSRRVFAIVGEYATVLERVSLDEAFAEPPELVGAAAEDVEAFGARLRARISEETGLTASIGAGSGKQVAKIASDYAKPDGLVVVRRADERGFLAGLPVRALWGVGPIAEGKLRTIGVLTIGQFAALDEREAASLLGGAVGRELHRLANGHDDRPVSGRAEAKQVSAETTFDIDIVDLPTLRAEARRVARGAHLRLVKSGRAARTVGIKVRHTDMSTINRSETATHGSTDPDRLAAVAERLLPDPAEFGPVRLVGVSFSGLVELRQEPLFELELPEEPVPGGETAVARPMPVRSGWRPGDDVRHPGFGTGWVQGAGHGRVTVRFETALSGPGRAHTFAQDDPALTRGDALDSLGPPPPGEPEADPE